MWDLSSLTRDQIGRWILFFFLEGGFFTTGLPVKSVVLFLNFQISCNLGDNWKVEARPGSKSDCGK